MRYWIINGRPVRGQELHTALSRYGQTYESNWKLPIGSRDSISWRRINKEEYDKLMKEQKP